MSEQLPVYEEMILKELRAIQRAYDASERKLEEWNAAIRRDIDTTLRAVQVNTARLVDNVADLRKNQQELERHWDADLQVRKDRQAQLDRRLSRIEVILMVISAGLAACMALSALALWFAVSNLGR